MCHIFAVHYFRFKNFVTLYKRKYFNNETIIICKLWYYDFGDSYSASSILSRTKVFPTSSQRLYSPPSKRS